MVCYQKFINALGLNLFIIKHAYMMPKAKFKLLESSFPYAL